MAHVEVGEVVNALIYNNGEVIGVLVEMDDHLGTVVTAADKQHTTPLCVIRSATKDEAGRFDFTKIIAKYLGE